MPQAALSNAYLDNVDRPASGMTPHWDTTVKGFVAHVQPNATTLYFQIDQRGKTKRINLGRYPTVTVKAARDAARDLDHDMRFGRAKDYGRKDITLHDALNAYLDTTQAGKQQVAYIKRSIEIRLEDWLDLPLTAITGKMIKKRHRDLTPEGPVMADETLRALRVVWNVAREEFDSHVLPSCPTDVLRRRAGKQASWNNPEPVRNQPIYDLVEWREAVDRIINPIHQEFYRFALLTALRKNEVARIEWKHIDRERRFLTIPVTKNGKQHFLPLNDHHFAILDRIERQGDYVFPDKSGKKPVVHPRHEEVPGTLHSLRHTFASIAAEIGMPEEQIGRLLNHSNGMRSVTGRYVHIQAESLRPAMDAITDEIVERLNRAEIADCV